MMVEKLNDLISKLPKQNIINLMWEALDIMESYNGRSKTNCILRAMNAMEFDEGKYKLPSVEKLREATNQQGL